MLKSYDELREENQELRYKIEQLKETLAHLNRERRHIRAGLMRDEMIVEFRDKAERYREALQEAEVRAQCIIELILEARKPGDPSVGPLVSAHGNAVYIRQGARAALAEVE